MELGTLNWKREEDREQKRGMDLPNSCLIVRRRDSEICDCVLFLLFCEAKEQEL